MTSGVSTGDSVRRGTGRIMRTVRPALLIVAGFILIGIWLLPPIYVAPALVTCLLVGACLRFPALGLCLLAFSVPWGGGYPITLGSFPITATDVLVAAVTLAWLTSALYGESQWLPRTPLTPYLALYIAAISLSATQAADTHASAREVIKWLELALVYWAAFSLLHDVRQVEAVIGCVVLAGVSQALLGCAQFAFHSGPQSFGRGAFLRAFGTFDQPNPYAGFLNMTLPFALAMGLRHVAPFARPWYRLATCVIAGGILVSGSRGAYLSGIIATVVILTLSVPWLRTWVSLGALALALGAWLATYNLVPVGPFQKILGAVGLGNVSFGAVSNNNFSAVERAAHWLAGVRMFAAHPLLGVGIGNYSTAYPSYHPRGWYAPLAHAHDYYINVAAEAGVTGLVAYLLLAGSALWYSYAALRRVSDGVLYAAILGVIGALFATYFHNLFDVLYVHGMAALTGLLLALVSVSLKIGRGQSAVARSVSGG